MYIPKFVCLCQKQFTSGSDNPSIHVLWDRQMQASLCPLSSRLNNQQSGQVRWGYFAGQHLPFFVFWWQSTKQISKNSNNHLETKMKKSQQPYCFAFPSAEQTWTSGTWIATSSETSYRDTWKPRIITVVQVSCTVLVQYGETIETFLVKLFIRVTVLSSRDHSAEIVIRIFSPSETLRCNLVKTRSIFSHCTIIPIWQIVPNQDRS